jgi:glycogen debranching enzyme
MTSRSLAARALHGLDAEHCAGPNPLIDPVRLERTLCELGRVDHLADLGTNGPLVASAGAHSLFHCLFGRDALRMAHDLLDDFPAVARATLVELARLQGVCDNARREEEPGRILHEDRPPNDPHAIRLTHELGWEFPYYGAVDTTPQWIRLLGAYCARSGTHLLDDSLVDRRGRRVTLRDSLLAAVAWIVRRLNDPVGGGYLWVRRAQPQGIPNQVWEDSPDSYYFEDGTLFDFTRPYAPVAVQGYAYDALLAAATLLEQAPGRLPVDPQRLRERAAALRTRVLAEFWQADLGTFAQALAVEPDASLRPARVVASSPGHLLASRLLDGPEATRLRQQVIARLREHDLLAGAGIRTKSTTASRFGAGTYHNGSSWPMDTGVIADGLRRHGRPQQAADLERRILRACGQVGGFPEFFRAEADGSVRVNRHTLDVLQDGLVNRLEQPPQANQGWTVTRVWRIVRRRCPARANGASPLTARPSASLVPVPTRPQPGRRATQMVDRAA